MGKITTSAGCALSRQEVTKRQCDRKAVTEDRDKKQKGKSKKTKSAEGRFFTLNRGIVESINRVVAGGSECHFKGCSHKLGVVRGAGVERKFRRILIAKPRVTFKLKFGRTAPSIAHPAMNVAHGV